MIKNSTKKINLLDCTFRDGGYYNNWEFNYELINNYLKFIKKVSIKFVEIGFFTLKKRNTLGITANIDKSFFNNIEIPKGINIGIMINASELINFGNYIDVKKRLNDIDYKKTKFIRIACHLNELSKLKKYLIYFKKKEVKIFLNLMQASEIQKKHLKYVGKNLNFFIDYFYFADSFGSLNTFSTGKLLKLIKNNIKVPFGIHAHDNLKLALKNSITSIRQGASWVDGTIYGMGRGPGNTKTEDLILNVSNNKNFKNLKIYKVLKKNFDVLMNKYCWGSNKFYRYSGRNKIHPTYVQMLLADKRISQKNFLSILKNIAEHKSKKFDPNELYSATFFYKKKINKSENIDREFLKKFEKFVILNSQLKDTKFNLNIEKVLNDKKCLKIMINETKNKRLERISEMNVICHPIRLMSINKFSFKPYKKILLPLSNIPNSKNLIKNRNKVIDFPIIIKNKISINKSHVSLPEPLSLIYTICFLISSSLRKISLVGFAGYNKTDPFQDKTQEFFSILLQRYKDLKLISLTKTNFNLN